MADEKEHLITEWKPVSDLRGVDKDISGLCYPKAYAVEHGFYEKKEAYSTYRPDQPEEMVDFCETLEIKVLDGKVSYRENDSFMFGDDPERFDTQFGTFINHNHGEFGGWLEKDDSNRRTRDKGFCNFPYPKGVWNIRGNFCDMFDCGPYSFAVSNLMHMGMGSFSIVRIDVNMKSEDVVNYDSDDLFLCFEYMGRYANGKGWIVIVSGYSWSLPAETGKPEYKTVLFRICPDGSCTICQEWDFRIPSANSMVAADGYVWFGHNRMVSRLNPTDGELKYFTNKSDEDLSALASPQEMEEKRKDRQK